MAEAADNAASHSVAGEIEARLRVMNPDAASAIAESYSFDASALPNQLTELLFFLWKDTATRLSELESKLASRDQGTA